MLIRFAKHVFLVLWRGVGWALELAVSPRGLPLCFLAGAALLVCGGWVRPPLSPDIRPIALPLGIDRSITPPAEMVIASPRHMYWHSAGALMFLVIGIGAMVVALWPNRIGTVAGIILACTIGAHCTLLNQPSLIELFDLELAQRRQLVTMLGNSPIWSPLPDVYNGRIQRLGLPGDDEMWGDVTRATAYLVFGQWLIVWAGVGCLLGTSGALWRRLAATGGFALVGVLLLSALSAGRLHAEYYWQMARNFETMGRQKEARAALDHAVELYPEFKRMQRTWLLAGKIDLCRGNETPQGKFFLAFQLKRDKESERAFTAQEDIEWEFTYADDPRDNLVADLVGPDLGVDPSFTGARDYHLGLPPLEGTLVKQYRRDRVLDDRRATNLLNQLLEDKRFASAAVRHQAADFWVVRGLIDYMANPIFSDSGGMSYVAEDRQLSSAQAKWEQAARLEPARGDCTFYLGYVQARLDPQHPEIAEATFGPILNEVADRVLRAEAYNVLGDTYLDAGRLSDARRRFAQSMDLFNLPKVINYRGQRGLGGL